MREGGTAWKMGEDDLWCRPDLLTTAEVRKYSSRYSRADAEEAGVGSLQHQLANSNPLLVYAGVAPPAYRAMLAETGVPAAAAIALWVKLARLFLQTLCDIIEAREEREVEWRQLRHAGKVPIGQHYSQKVWTVGSRVMTPHCGTSMGTWTLKNFT